MKTKKILAATGIALGLTGGGISATYAADNNPKQHGPEQELVEAIAQKFNLNEAEVQSVFDEEHTNHGEMMKRDFEKRLDEAVANSEITIEQANAITKKQAELEANKRNFEAMTPEEREADMKQHAEEMQQWAQENSIPDAFVPFGHPHDRHQHAAQQ